jgi:hypothetical protein
MVTVCVPPSVTLKDFVFSDTVSYDLHDKHLLQTTSLNRLVVCVFREANTVFDV